MQLGNIQTNSKGGKYLPLRGQGGDPPTWKSEWLKFSGTQKLGALPEVLAEAQPRRPVGPKKTFISRTVKKRAQRIRRGRTT